MDIVLFDQVKINIIQCNHGVFKSFDINQSESIITYREILIFFDLNQSAFTQNGVFNNFDINQSE